MVAPTTKDIVPGSLLARKPLLTAAQSSVQKLPELADDGESIAAADESNSGPDVESFAIF